MDFWGYCVTNGMKRYLASLPTREEKLLILNQLKLKVLMTENSTTDEQFSGSLLIQENAEAADCEFAENLSDIDEAINCINYVLEEH